MTFDPPPAPERTTTRRCDLCRRVVELDALRPGWDVVRVDGEPAWRCPDCMRAGRTRP